MTEHPYQLYAIPFTEADQGRLVGFSCGNEPWAAHVAEWITGSSVVDSMKRGTRVWLFETGEDEIVGFGAAGIARWKWPPPDGSPAPVVLLPMLGIEMRFRGQPADLEWRYSRQIISHLIAEAQAIANSYESEPKPQWIVLLVHRENQRAIRCYEKHGFELIPGVERRNDHLVMKLWIGSVE